MERWLILGAWLNVDQSRVHATGLSNGAAFSHRLACERAETFAAIATVAGSNQFSTGAPCEPERPIAVLQVHGTDDPCWGHETSDARCLGNGGDKLGALESVTGWATRDGCVDEPRVEHFPTSSTMGRSPQRHDGRDVTVGSRSCFSRSQAGDTHGRTAARHFRAIAWDGQRGIGGVRSCGDS